MFSYSRQVFYYETDSMGVVHHSNYIRWMEEARTAYFDANGAPYAGAGSDGVHCPVVGVNAEYKRMARYGDVFFVSLKMTAYNGVRFTVEYEITNKGGELLFKGESYHCFLAADTLRPVSLKRSAPKVHETMEKLVQD